MKIGENYDQEFRVVELEAVASALREDLPKDWNVQCVAACGPLVHGVKEYKPGHRWILVTIGGLQVDVGLAHGEISTRLGRYNSIVIPMATPDALDQFSKKLKAAVVNYMEMVTVGN